MSQVTHLRVRHEPCASSRPWLRGGGHASCVFRSVIREVDEEKVLWLKLGYHQLQNSIRHPVDLEIGSV